MPTFNLGSLFVIGIHQFQNTTTYFRSLPSYEDQPIFDPINPFRLDQPFSDHPNLINLFSIQSTPFDLTKSSRSDQRFLIWSTLHDHIQATFFKWPYLGLHVLELNPWYLVGKVLRKGIKWKRSPGQKSDKNPINCREHEAKNLGGKWTLQTLENHIRGYRKWN
jgi:hypothetical protein